ncbi:hypothetical protein L226DRAFT_110158 [Lentinus tigrinus ALCF2SS1-7]|uniref:uncharacterized protein n=1 Tax=Lentinus tigrinus ALCF2SS1-7 TaxID=1328758 RepID=UPI0011662071|nr:hypothetical protein L226DRAFT_110158 [Lentinus tigrinus ALCF2SS1-7]
MIYLDFVRSSWKSPAGFLALPVPSVMWLNFNLELLPSPCILTSECGPWTPTPECLCLLVSTRRVGTINSDRRNCM